MNQSNNIIYRLLYLLLFFQFSPYLYSQDTINIPNNVGIYNNIARNIFAYKDFKIEDYSYFFDGYVVIQIDASNKLEMLSKDIVSWSCPIYWVDSLQHIKRNNDNYYFNNIGGEWSNILGYFNENINSSSEFLKLYSFLRTYKLLNDKGDCKSFLYDGDSFLNYFNTTLFKDSPIFYFSNNSNINYVIYHVMFWASIILNDSYQNDIWRLIIPISNVYKFEKLDCETANIYGLKKNSNKIVVLYNH
ncbi:MAG: hypothetical protein NTY74_10680 [Ignavibacteriae bacterium]|nr:hypothetical protein [Ignavibacteriota bacterium]